MASTISAGLTTTTALVYSADTSGVLQLQTNGTTTAVTIDTSQNVGINNITPTNYYTSSRNLIVGSGSGDAGITIATGNSSVGMIAFSGGTGTTIGSVSNRGKIWYNQSSDSMNFSTSGSLLTNPNVTIDSSGNLLVGTTSYVGITSAGGQVTFGAGGTSSTNTGFLALNGSSASGYGAAIGGYANGTNGWFIGSYSSIVSGTNTYLAMRNSGGGGVYLNGSSATSWTAVSSDVREKKDFAPVEGLTQLLQVVPTKYRYTWEDESHPIHMGFTAQNIQPLIPDMVVTRNEKAEDGTNLLTVTMDYMIPVLVQSIKDLNAIVTTLQSQVAALKA